MTISIQICSFLDVLPVWQDRLWPGRHSSIEPVSAINEEGSIDMNLMQSNPTFWSATHSFSKLTPIGVVSGYKTSPLSYRSRGLFVDQELRRNKIATRLLESVFSKAKSENCHSVWTMARQTALPFYQAIGFEVSKKITHFEFGPHFMCVKSLSNL